MRFHSASTDTPVPPGAFLLSVMRDSALQSDLPAGDRMIGAIPRGALALGASVSPIPAAPAHGVEPPARHEAPPRLPLLALGVVDVDAHADPLDGGRDRCGRGRGGRGELPRARTPPGLEGAGDPAPPLLVPADEHLPAESGGPALPLLLLVALLVPELARPRAPPGGGGGGGGARSEALVCSPGPYVTFLYGMPPGPTWDGALFLSAHGEADALAISVA